MKRGRSLRRRYGHHVERMTRAEFEAKVEHSLAEKYGAAQARKLMGDWSGKIHASYAVRAPVAAVVRDIIKYERG